MQFFSSVDEISSKIWRELDCSKNSYFHPDFLKSIEKYHPKITFSYIVLIDKNNRAIALATIQIIDFYIDDIKNDLEFLIRKIKNLGRKLQVFPKKKPLKLLISGNVFFSGEYGIFIRENQDKKIIIKEVAKAILHFVESDKKIKIDAFLLKDFINESLYITDELKNYKYHPFSAEPNMTLQIDESWENFDDYLAAMKTKFRVKARKAFKKSLPIRIEEVTNSNIKNQIPKMTRLYRKVAANADFNLGILNLKAYEDLKEKWGDNYILKSYWLEDKIVGFMSGIINQNSLDAHFVGLDYQLNKAYSIYQRILYDYIEIAINKKLQTINFGRTASEIKSSVGAKPQDLTMYLRHKKSIKNRILKLFLQRIKPTPFRQKFPFKKVDPIHEK